MVKSGSTKTSSLATLYTVPDIILPRLKSARLHGSGLASLIDNSKGSIDITLQDTVCPALYCSLSGFVSRSQLYFWHFVKYSLPNATTRNVSLPIDNAYNRYRELFLLPAVIKTCSVNFSTASFGTAKRFRLVSTPFTIYYSCQPLNTITVRLLLIHSTH